jgi:hypothetical protein
MGVNLPGCSFGFSVTTRGRCFCLPELRRVSDSKFFQVRQLSIPASIIEYYAASETIGPASVVDLYRMAVVRSPNKPRTYGLSIEFGVKPAFGVKLSGRAQSMIWGLIDNFDGCIVKSVICGCTARMS